MKIAIFACHNSIWWWGIFLSYFGVALKKIGYQVDLISIGNLVDYGMAIGMRMNSSSEDKKSVQERSERNTKWLARGFGFNSIRLDAFSLIGMVEPGKDLQEKIKTYANYETILVHKKYSEFTAEMIEMRDSYGSANRDIYIAADQYFKNNKPDLTLVWNALYSFNRTWNLAAENNNVPAYWIHAGANRGFEFQSIMFGDKHWYEYSAMQKENWKEVETGVSLTKNDVDTIVSHLTNTISGKTIFSYSKPKQNLYFKQSRNIGNRKLVVMATSSHDELLAAQAVGAKALGNNPVFQEQIEWIEFVLDSFSKSNDHYIVLRVHPRDFPNHRENRHSENTLFYTSLSEKYKDSHSVYINLPQDNISLYDLLEEADLVLNAWSSAGEEAGMLGIPVISAFQNYCNYPENLEAVYCNKMEYLNAIKNEIEVGWSARRALRFLKWRVFSTLHKEVFLSHEYSEIGNSEIGNSRSLLRNYLAARRMINWMKSEQVEDALYYFNNGKKYQNRTVNNNNFMEDDDILSQYFNRIYNSLYENLISSSNNTLQNYIYNFLKNPRK